MHVGTGPGLSSRSLGQKLGVQSVVLDSTEIPSHSHAAMGSSTNATAATPQGNLAAPTVGSFNVYGDAANLAAGAAGQLGESGGDGHNNMQPYNVLNFCIALQGVFASRN